MEEIVSTKIGQLKGVHRDGLWQFHGIPYAQAPIEDLRFKKPILKDGWDGIYDATYRHPIAPQGVSDLDLPMGPITLPRSEDCLTLAINTPDLHGKRPVAVWLHGGANCYGGGDVAWYDGGNLALAEDIVVVNLNFRQGPFGFLNYPGLNQSTLAIEDQICALKWIKSNISEFGGDPDHITLFGQSAGGNAIVHLLCRDDTEGLFHKVILESPSIGRGNHLQADANEIGKAVLEKLGIDLTTEETIAAQVQKKSTSEILQAADHIPAEFRSRFQLMVFKPIMDECHTPEQTALRAAHNAAKRNIPVIIGMTKNEMFAFVTDRDKETVEKLHAAQQARYDGPADTFALQVAAEGGTLYRYMFDWAAPDSIYGACHTIELAFVFGNYDIWNAPMLNGASPLEMKKLTKTMQDLWGKFIRSEQFGVNEWPAYTEASQAIKHFDNDTNPVVCNT